MITNFFLSIAYTISLWFINLFPAINSISGFISAFAKASTYLYSASGILPLTITALLACIAIYVALEIGIFSFKIFNWVWGKIPFIGKK